MPVPMKILPCPFCRVDDVFDADDADEEFRQDDNKKHFKMAILSYSEEECSCDVKGLLKAFTSKEAP